MGMNTNKMHTDSSLYCGLESRDAQRRGASLVLLVLALAMLLGCRRQPQPGEEELAKAKQEFSDTYTCPVDRLSAVVRADVSPVRLVSLKPDEPPAEIARDPGRLAQWQEKQRERTEGYTSNTVVEVKGCEHHIYYLCDTVSQTVNGQGPYLVMNCSKPRYTPEGTEQER